MESADAVVIGAGVIGLAIARQLSLEGREVIILESENAIGTATSSRNSEVIHAGIYYPHGSLKARSCVEGRALLYRYCSERGIPHVLETNTIPGMTPLSLLPQEAASAGITFPMLLDRLIRSALLRAGRA